MKLFKVVLFVMVAAVLSLSSPVQAAENTVKVGAILSITGPASFLGAPEARIRRGLYGVDFDAIAPAYERRLAAAGGWKALFWLCLGVVLGTVLSRRLANAQIAYRGSGELANAAQPGWGTRMGVLLLESGQAADAVAELENAVKTSPTAANRFALATAYLKARQNEKALPLIAAAVQQEPRNVELRLTLGRLLREAKNMPGAAQEFLNAAQADPKSKDAWRELASTL